MSPRGTEATRPGTHYHYLGAGGAFRGQGSTHSTYVTRRNTVYDDR